MTEKNTGGSAFPFAATDRSNTDMQTSGMTLRDYFAGQALSSMHIGSTGVDLDSFHQFGARYAYAIADYMLEARGK